MQTNFLLGEIKLTTAARLQLKRIPLDLICRHAINEHGHITASEARRNASGMDTLGAIISLRIPRDAECRLPARSSRTGPDVQ